MTLEELEVKHILVVDDDEVLRSIVVEGLIDQGYKVIEAENGKAALWQLETHSTDIVVTDISMPEMDGLELITHLKTKAPKTYHIIAMTAGLTSLVSNDPATQKVMLKTADALGAVRTLEKPFRMQALIDLLAEIS
jgi:CheY-like chemotaxis protein